MDQRLVEVLEDARSRGFLGPGPATFVVEHARGLEAAAYEAASRFVDLGSGGGIPGLVLAMDWPASEALLLDSRQKSCAWLGEAIERLRLEDRVSVACGRAEDLARQDDLRGSFDLVVARSFGPPAVTAECAVGFLAPAGRLVVSESPLAAGERWPAEGLAELGLSAAAIRRAGDVTAAVMKREGVLADRWPRRAGIPAKRPVW